MTEDTEVSQKNPHRSTLDALDPMKVDEALEKFGASKRISEQKITLLKPVAVFSNYSYSTPLFPPIGLAYLAALVEKAGYNVSVVDAVGSDIKNISPTKDGKMKCQGLSVNALIDRIDPETKIIGISLMFSQEWVVQRKLIFRLREAFSEAVILVGGEHATALPELILSDCSAIDFVVTGEGELTFLRLVHGILSGHSIGDLRGIAYLDVQGQYINNGLGLRIADIQNLPRPAWHLIPLENYLSGNWSFGIGNEGAKSRNIPILATRGCPYQCTFCSNPTMWTTRYTMRSPVDVVDEIDWLIDTYQATSIDFADLTAIVKKEWVLDFCKELKRRNRKITWQLPSGTRSEALDHEVLKEIYETGCRFLVYAPESGSSKTLKSIKKKVKINNIIPSIKNAVQIGHTTKVNFIIGFPDEDRQSVWQTFLTVIRLAFAGVDDCNVHIFAPYPGSELYKQLREEGAIAELDDKYFNDLFTQFDFTSLASYCKNVPTNELRIVRTLAMALFYGFSYFLYPSRLYLLARKIWSKNFKPRSLFEQRVYDYLIRARLFKSNVKS